MGRASIFDLKFLLRKPVIYRWLPLFLSATVSCSLVATRPVQTMSDTQAAIKAAKEVQAETLAPELYRQSNEWFFRAKNEYKLKNFDLAKEYADKARRFAEMAEFESLKNGATRAEVIAPDPLATQPATPYEYPTPTATPFDPNPKGSDSSGGGAPAPGK